MAAGPRAQEGRGASRCTDVPCHVFRAFGLTVRAECRLVGIPDADGDGGGPHVDVRLVDEATLDAAWSGSYAPPVWETVMGDGVAFTHQIGRAGDHRFVYGRDSFHLAADAATVLCAPADDGGAAWQRQLLDTILFSASFIHGFELLHASAVETEQGVVGFLAATGAGKTSLAAELMRRGMVLFCDDVLALRDGADSAICFPGPPVMSLPERLAAPAALGGSFIARFSVEAEVWISLQRSAAAPAPLAALYLLNRGHGGVEEVAPTVLDLMPHAISLPHDAERARSRFALFSELAQRVPLRRLYVGEDDPAALADRVEASLGRKLAGAPA